MFGLLKDKCQLCNRKFRKMLLSSFLNDENKEIKVCRDCLTYAERRAFRKVNN